MCMVKAMDRESKQTRKETLALPLVSRVTSFTVGKEGRKLFCMPVRSIMTVNQLICIHTLWVIVQELCDSRGGRPGLSVLTSLLVSVDVKLY